MIMIARMIRIIPIHCVRITFSFKRTNAIITETGSSRAETILPKPIPVNGKPKFIRIGGIIVPNKDKIIPHFRKIARLKGVT
jgi:hypothetical protein